MLLGYTSPNPDNNMTQFILIVFDDNKKLWENAEITKCQVNMLLTVRTSTASLM